MSFIEIKIHLIGCVEWIVYKRRTFAIQTKKLLMKPLLKISAIALVSLMSSCTVETIDAKENYQDFNQETANVLTCSGADPQYQFTNNGTVPFTLSIYGGDNNGVLNQDLDVAPGSITDMKSFAAGEVLFSFDCDISGISDIKVVFDMNNCNELQLVIDEDNNLLDAEPIEL